MSAIQDFYFSAGNFVTKVYLTSSVKQIKVSPDFLLIDEEVSKLFKGQLPLSRNTMIIPGGEQSKTAEMLNKIWQRMSEAQLRRDSLVVIIGGGTVCDIGAFAASTWKRGVKLTLVPTTLLCMVDASLGGKTAINVSGSKNQAGTVYPASEIIVCTEFLKTLSKKEMLNGLSEALKTAVIGNKEIVDYLLNKDYQRAVAACLEVKGNIVAQDLNENGQRRLLNLGHTIGHCIEAVSKFSIGHGIAVAKGIPVEARMQGNIAFAEKFSEIAGKLGIDTSIPSSISLQDISVHMDSDKKTTKAGRIWIVPEDWEKCNQILLTSEEEKDLLEKAWQ